MPADPVFYFLTRMNDIFLDYNVAIIIAPIITIIVQLPILKYYKQIWVVAFSFTLFHGLGTRCPKSLHHFLKPHISKTIMHNVNFKIYLERTNLGNYYTKLNPIRATAAY